MKQTFLTTALALALLVSGCQSIHAAATSAPADVVWGLCTPVATRVVVLGGDYLPDDSAYFTAKGLLDLAEAGYSDPIMFGGEIANDIVKTCDTQDFVLDSALKAGKVDDFEVRVWLRSSKLLRSLVTGENP